MNNYSVTLFINNKKAEVIIKSNNATTAFHVAKSLFPKALIVKAIKI